MNLTPENVSFVKLSFSEEPTADMAMTENTELLHILSGTAEVEVGNTSIRLVKDDIYIVNMGTLYGIQTDHCLYARFVISAQQFIKLLGKAYAVFDCTPERKESPEYQRLEVILWKIYEAVLNEDSDGNSIQMTSLSYQIAELLAASFMKKEASGPEDGSKQEIMRDAEILQFIHGSYTEPITLEMLAKKLFLSNAYLSKYIKKHFGMNYVDLVNSVRLKHAVEDLKYGNESVTRIAMANGFSSVVAFNRSFRDSYGVSPTVYKQSMRRTEKGAAAEEKEALRPELIKRVQEGIAEFRERERHADAFVLMKQEIDAFEKGKERLSGSWKKVINAGTAYNLTRSDYQQQILFLHEHIGFEYIRFWDVFSPELRINIHSAPQNANFHTLFMIIDFLIDNGMKPFLELGFKPLRISRSTASAIIDSHREDAFSSPEELQAFAAELGRQLVGRYGQREVDSWYFEYWKRDPVLLYVNQIKRQTEEDDPEPYLKEFDALCYGIRSAVPNARIGGGGFTFRSYGEGGIRNILTRWKQHPHLPDFVSFNCFCYQNRMEDGKLHQRRYEDRHFINRTLAAVRRIMKEIDYPERELFVTEFNFSVSNRNPMNDSCGRAAELLRLFLCTMKETDVLGYWTALDAYAEFSDTTAPVFGGVGLLSKDGITKPSYYVFDFLNRLDEEIVERNEDYIISRQGTDSFKVLCHNFRGFTDALYEIEREDTISVQDISNYFADRKEKRIHLRLRNIQNGKYQIRMREIDSQSGSVQNVWRRLNYDDHLDREDIRFIRQMCIPSMWRMETEVYDGTLDFEIILPPNSVKYIHFILRKS